MSLCIVFSAAIPRVGFTKPAVNCSMNSLCNNLKIPVQLFGQFVREFSVNVTLDVSADDTSGEWGRNYSHLSACVSDFFRTVKKLHLDTFIGCSGKIFQGHQKLLPETFIFDDSYVVTACF